MVSGMVVLAVTYLASRHRHLAGLLAGTAALAGVSLIGAALTCGILTVLAYYAVPLWYLGATPAEHVLGAHWLGKDGSWSTLRHLLEKTLDRP